MHPATVSRALVNGCVDYVLFISHSLLQSIANKVKVNLSHRDTCYFIKTTDDVEIIVAYMNSGIAKQQNFTRFETRSNVHYTPGSSTVHLWVVHEATSYNQVYPLHSGQTTPSCLHWHLPSSGVSLEIPSANMVHRHSVFSGGIIEVNFAGWPSTPVNSYIHHWWPNSSRPWFWPSQMWVVSSQAFQLGNSASATHDFLGWLTDRAIHWTPQLLYKYIDYS